MFPLCLRQANIVVGIELFMFGSQSTWKMSKMSSVTDQPSTSSHVVRSVSIIGVEVGCSNPGQPGLPEVSFRQSRAPDFGFSMLMT